MRECPSCGLEFDDPNSEAAECPYCGYEFPEPSRGTRWAAIGFALLMLYPLWRTLDWLLG